MIVKNYDFLQKHFFRPRFARIKKTNPADEVRFCLFFDFSYTFFNAAAFL